jgi:hypothetical protein
MSFTAAGDSSVGAPYAYDAAIGRGSVTVNDTTTFGDTRLVFYVVAPRTIEVMDAGSVAPVIGALVQ